VHFGSQLPIRFQDVEGFANADDFFIQLIEQIALHIAELQRLLDHAHFAVDLEQALTGGVVEEKILPKRIYAGASVAIEPAGAWDLPQAALLAHAIGLITSPAWLIHFPTMDSYRGTFARSSCCRKS
jgi:hypothetical protein